MRKIFKSLSWVTLSRFFSSLISLGIVLYVGFKFEINGVALFGSYMIIGRFLQTIIDYGISTYGIVFLTKNIKSYKSFLVFLIFQKLLLSLLALPIFILFAKILFDGDLKTSIFAALYFILLGLTISLASIFESKKMFFNVSIGWFVSSFIIILFFLFDFINNYIVTIDQIFIFLLIGTSTQVIYLFISAFRFVTKQSLYQDNNYLISTEKSRNYLIWMKNASPYFFFSLLGVSYVNIDRLVMLILAEGTVSLGLFYFAARIANLFEILGSIVSKAIFPYVCQNHDEMKFFIKRKIKYYFLFLIAILPIASAGYYILINLFFEPFKPSLVFFVILIISYSFRNISYIYGTILSSLEHKQVDKLKTSTIVFVFGLIISIPLVYFFKAYGAAVSSVIINIFLVLRYRKLVDK